MALLSIILTVHNPEQYFVLNESSKMGLKKIGLLPAGLEKLPNGEKYVRILEPTKQIRNLSVDLNFPMVDWILFRISEDTMDNSVNLAMTFEKNGISEDEPKQPPPRVESIVIRVVRDTVKSRNLKLRYSFRCQICGLAIDIPGKHSYCEVHHIVPLGNPHNGLDDEHNMICLCPNHHTEYDKGVMYIEPDSRMIVHFDPRNRFHNQKLIDLHDIDDDAFLELVENSKIEPYELLEFFVEEWPLTLDAPMPSYPSPADVLYTGGVLNAIFIAYPVKQILAAFDLVTCYLVRFIDPSLQDEFTKKCQVYSELIKKIPKSYAPLTTMKPNRHRDVVAKHILRFTRHDLKKLVSKLPSVDIGFVEDDFITTNPKDSLSFQEQKEVILHQDPRRMVLSILRTPLIRVGKEFLTSSMLMINSYMDFIQTTARRSERFRHRKGIALEHGLCASMMKLGRTTKLILIQSKDDSKWNSQSRINLSRIREETQRWKIPLEEIVIPNIPYPYMEFDLVLEVDGYPPLFIEAKANSFTTVEYTLGFNYIYSRMLEQHQKLRKKLAMAIEHEDFLIRFGTDIEGLLLSQDSVLSAGILDLHFKDFEKIHQALRRLVDTYGVTPRSFGDGLVAIFGNELEHN